MKGTAGSIVLRLLDSFSPKQICWLCLLFTISIAGWGFATFARESDVTAIRVELLQGRLLDLRIRQCTAIKEGQSAVFFARQYAEQADKYEELTGRQPKTADCAEL